MRKLSVTDCTRRHSDAWTAGFSGRLRGDPRPEGAEAVRCEVLVAAHQHLADHSGEDRARVDHLLERGKLRPDAEVAGEELVVVQHVRGTEMRFELHVLEAQALLIDAPLHRVDNFFHLKGFENVVESAAFHRVDC